MRHPGKTPTLLLRHPVAGLPGGGPLLSSPRVAGRPMVIILAPGNLSPVYVNVLTASGSRLGGRGVKGDSQSWSLTRWLHHLLVQGCWSAPEEWVWLVDGWCDLWYLWHQEPSCSERPFTIRPSQWEVCMMGL